MESPTGPWPNPTANQLAALQQLWPELISGNRFYQTRLAPRGLMKAPATLEEFTAQVPFTTKAELAADQAANPPYGTTLTYPVSRYTRCHQTSGTRGTPLRWLDTPESWSAMVEDWANLLRVAGVGPGDRILFAFSFGPFLGFWLAFEAGQRLGALCLAGGGMSSPLRLRVLVEQSCTVLCCTPTYALHLAEVAATENIDLTRGPIRTLVVAGEPGGSLPATRQRLQNAWNARVFDHHGMTETGPVTYEDPQQPGCLQLFHHSFFAEIIDPETGKEQAEGKTGELVLTTLRRQGSPLLRYRTGDLVRARVVPSGNPSLSFEGGILGRADDMVIVRGVNVYPTAIEEIVRGVPEVEEYRVTFDTRGALAELKLEVEAGEAIAAEVAQRLRRSLGLRIEVTPVSPRSLPRFEHKAHRWQRR